MKEAHGCFVVHGQHNATKMDKRPGRLARTRASERLRMRMRMAQEGNELLGLNWTIALSIASRPCGC